MPKPTKTNRRKLERSRHSSPGRGAGAESTRGSVNRGLREEPRSSKGRGAATGPGRPLDRRTKDELDTIARSRGTRAFEQMRKSELVEALRVTRDQREAIGGERRRSGPGRGGSGA
jgi:hypothetical protein